MTHVTCNMKHVTCLPDVEGSPPGLFRVYFSFDLGEEGGEILEVLFRHPLEPGSGVAGLDGDLGELGLTGARPSAPLLGSLVILGLLLLFSLRFLLHILDMSSVIFLPLLTSRLRHGGGWWRVL